MAARKTLILAAVLLACCLSLGAAARIDFATAGGAQRSLLQYTCTQAKQLGPNCGSLCSCVQADPRAAGDPNAANCAGLCADCAAATASCPADDSLPAQCSAWLLPAVTDCITRGRRLA